jgi:hypothetical protein
MNYVTRVFHFRRDKSSSGTIEEKLVIHAYLDIFINILHIFFPTLSINKNIIKEDKHKVAKKVSINTFNEDIKSGCSIENTKIHH